MAKRVFGGAADENLPYSNVVQAGDLYFLSGIVGFDDEEKIVPGGVGPETRQILQRVDALLSEVGCTLDDVVKVKAYLTNPNDFDDFNAVYKKFFSVLPPARATICAALTISCYRSCASAGRAAFRLAPTLHRAH